LSCSQCEDHLRSDPLWAASPADIPETYDEKLNREDFEKRGAKDKDAIMTLAIAKLAGMNPDDLPESLTRMISGAKAHVPATVECPDGHANPLDQKFCGACGIPLHDIPLRPDPPAFDLDLGAAPVVPEPPESPPAVALPSNTKMRGMKREELVTLAAGAGLSGGGSRQDVLNRLLEYSNEHK
jgi:hypothetical protein